MSCVDECLTVIFIWVTGTSQSNN